MYESAPLYDDVADAPKGGAAYWLNTTDGVRIRVAAWPDGDKGTVLLFPGRTEYIEKYGPAAGELAARGYATLVIDWRGQGLSDRACKNHMAGHIGDFDEFQRDIDTMIDAAQTLDLPRPYYLVSHSMGGAIGLRALQNGLEVNAAFFSAPMWSLLIAPVMKPVATTLATVFTGIGMGCAFAPGTSEKSYVSNNPFDDNMLTTNEDMFHWLAEQERSYPDLKLGGPSMAWVKSALKECHALAKMPAPKTPTVTFLGSNERIVDSNAVTSYMQNWANGSLVMIDGAEHEILMEQPQTLKQAYDAMDTLFSQHR